MKQLGCFAFCLVLTTITFAQLPTGPNVLVVTSHPDDETISR